MMQQRNVAKVDNKKIMKNEERQLEGDNMLVGGVPYRLVEENMLHAIMKLF